jgi:ferredoxin--NADP+ reductase
MFTITGHQALATGITQLTVEAPAIARRAQAGQFVVLRVHQKGERIPLTIVATDPATGAITLIVQEIGRTTCALGALKPGDSILDMVGPLGHPTAIKQYGTVVGIAGGVGAAEILPVAVALRAVGNKVLVITGARTQKLLILTDQLQQATDKLITVTDDGSSGQKGFVTNALEELLQRQVHIDLVYAIGPVPMMRAVAALTRQHQIPTLVSLNPIMVDGTGMCGACRVSIGGETKFACVDGPEFDAQQVNWDELAARQNLFKKEEKLSYERHGSTCGCHKP